MAAEIQALRLSVLMSISLMLGACGLGSAKLRQAQGPLAPCDGGPHCVSSQSEDPKRYVEALRYTGSREAAHQRLVAVLSMDPAFKLIANTPDYLHVEVTTPIMRYVDDVEFLFAPREARIDVRSSSRIGYYDFQTNRERVEAIRTAFAKAP